MVQLANSLKNLSTDWGQLGSQIITQLSLITILTS